jgi:hypothetical protein
MSLHTCWRAAAKPYCSAWWQLAATLPSLAETRYTPPSLCAFGIICICHNSLSDLQHEARMQPAGSRCTIHGAVTPTACMRPMLVHHADRVLGLTAVSFPCPTGNHRHPSTSFHEVAQQL